MASPLQSSDHDVDSTARQLDKRVATHASDDNCDSDACIAPRHSPSQPLQIASPSLRIFVLLFRSSQSSSKTTHRRPTTMSILSHFLHITNFQSPLLRTIVPSVGAAIALQAVAGVPSVLAGTERFFDLSGSLTYLAVGALSLYLPQLRARVGNAALPRLLAAFGGGSAAAWNWRQVVVTSMAMLWATRRNVFPPSPRFVFSRNVPS